MPGSGWHCCGSQWPKSRRTTAGLVRLSTTQSRQVRVFFMRQEILSDSLSFPIDELRRRFLPIAEQFKMDWAIRDSAQKKRVAILVSKSGHCLYDLLSRWRSQELEIDIACVISNHNTFRGLVEWHGVPYHHVPVTPDTKSCCLRQNGDPF